MIEMKGVKQNLSNISVLYEDTSPESQYFNMSVPDVIPGGKTAISINPPPHLLKVSSQVKIEVVDALGNPVYVEFPNDPYVPAYQYGYSEPGSTARLIGVTVYPSTPYGYGEIIVVGEALSINGMPVPAQWKGIYNVRWRKRILLDRNVPNNSKVIFYKTPTVALSEIQKSYLNQVYAAGRVVTLNTGSQWIEYNAGRDYATVTARGFVFTQDMVGGLLSVPSPQVPLPSPLTDYGTFESYTTYIDSLVNESQAYVRNAYVATLKPSKYLGRFDTEKYLGVKYFSGSFSLTYNAAPGYVESPNLKSFVKFNITNLDTFSGDVYALKVFQGSDGITSGYKVIGEKNLEDTEILLNHDATDPSSQYMGVFTGVQTFNQYWATSSFDYYTEVDAPISYRPIITFDSSTLMNGMVVSSSVMWNDASKVVQRVFPTTQSYFNQGDQLELSFKLANMTNEGKLDVYAKGTAFYQNVRQLEKSWKSGNGGTSIIADVVGITGGGWGRYVNDFGKLLVNFSPDASGQFKTEKKLYGLVTVPIQTDFSGSGSINIAVRGGQWVISDVSFRYKRETNFSPSAFTFTMPLEPEQEGDAVSFGIKYYNKLGEEVVIPKTPAPDAPPNMTLGDWTGHGNYGTFGSGVGYSKVVLGPNTYIDGTRNVMSGSLWIGSQVGHYRYGEIIASGGMEFSADAAPGPSGSVGKGVLIRSLGYEGMWRASHGFGTPGFLIWSGSILPQSGDNYSGAGIEFWGSGSSLHFDTTSGILSITGSINATSGTIGGWQILSKELRSYPLGNISLSGSGAGYIVARDTNLVDRVFFGITPSSATASDGWRDPTSIQGVELVGTHTAPALDTDGGFEDLYTYIPLTSGTGKTTFIPGWNLPTNTYAWTGSSATSNHNGSVSLHFVNQGSGNARSASYFALTGSVISANATYYFSCWHSGEGALLSPSDARMDIYQYLGGTQPTLVTSDTFTFPTNGSWRQHSMTYTTPTGSFIGMCGTGSIYFEIVYTDRGESTGDVNFDDFTVRKYEYFTDVSQNGLYIFSSPTTYIKLGKNATSFGAFNEVTSSQIRLFGNLDIDGEIVNPDGGISLTGGITSAMRWLRFTSYPAAPSTTFTTYFDHTGSAYGGEVGGFINGVSYPLFGFSGSSTDYNIYSRVGGGSSVSKNRGWVFAGVEGADVQVPGIHMIVGRYNPFWYRNLTWDPKDIHTSADAAAILVRGPIWSANFVHPNRMIGLEISGGIDYLHNNSATGSFRYVDGSQSLGRVLTSDENGMAHWATSSGGSGGGITWNYVTTNTSMVVNNGYITSGSSILLTMPATSVVGSMFEITCQGGAWKVTSGSNTQKLFFGNATASFGLAGQDGFLSSSQERDSIKIVCTLADIEYNVVSSVGNIYIQ